MTMQILQTYAFVAALCLSARAGDEDSERLPYQALSGLVQAAHTTDLPAIDRIEVLALPLLDAEENADAAPQSRTFLVRPASPKPENGSLVIPASEIAVRPLASKVLAAKDASRIADDWRSLTFQPNGALCHIPTYGIRFYRGEELIFSVSVCWRCNNFYLPTIDPGSGQPSVKLFGFDDNAAAKRLLNDLRRLVPHPQIQHPRLR